MSAYSSSTPPPKPVQPLDASEMDNLREATIVDQGEQESQQAQGKEAQTKEAAKEAEKKGPETQENKEAQRSSDPSQSKKPDTQRQRQAEQSSRFEFDRGENKSTRPAGPFGKTTNYNPEVARQREQATNPQTSAKANLLSMLEETPEGQLLRQMLLPQRPTMQQYKALLAERFFQQGPLKGSPLHQKIQEQAIKQNLGTEQGQRFVEKVLEKGEVVQLFRLRHQGENKEHMRNILRYEIAKAKQSQMARQVQGLKQQTEGKQGREGAHLQGTKASQTELSRQQFAQKLSHSASQSKFEQVLQKVLAGAKKAVPDLPPNVRARFLAKTEAEWQEFFKNVSTMESVEIGAKGKLSQLIEALFRGIFKKTESGQMMLVADLALSEEGEVAENKFAQLLLDDPELMEMLKGLKPGDLLPKSVLQKLGSEFEFIKLANLLHLTNLTEEQKSEILRMYRQQGSTEAQKRLEYALIGQRQDQDKKDKNKDRGGENKEPFVYAGHVFDNKEQAKGSTKIFLYLFFGVMGVTAAFVIFLLFRHFF